MFSIALTLLCAAPLEPWFLPQEGADQEDTDSVVELGWKGVLGAGLSTSSGNTDSRNLHASVDAELREEKRRYSLGFHWLYADEAEDGPRELLERHAQAEGQVDFFLDERSYFLVTTDAETDKKAALDLRYSLGVGYGYQVVEEKGWSLSVEVGASGINEDFDGEEEKSYLAGRFGYSLERSLGERWILSQDSEVFPSLEEAEDVYVEVDTRLRCNLSENLYGQFQWIFDWDNTPAEEAERENHRLLFSVGYSF